MMAIRVKQTDESRRVRNICVVLFAIFVVFNHCVKILAGRSGFQGVSNLSQWSGTAPQQVMSSVDSARFQFGEIIYSQKRHCSVSIYGGCERVLFYTRAFLGLD